MCPPSGFDFVPLRRFDRCYKRLDPTDQESVDKALALFNDNPSHPSLRIEKIEKRRNIWSIRGSRSVRITFNWEGHRIILRATSAAHDIYKNP